MSSRADGCLRYVLLVIGGGLLLFGIAAAFLVASDDDGGDADRDEATPAAAPPAEPEPEAEVGEAAADPGPDELCSMHSQFSATIAAIGTVDGPSEYQANIEAFVDFYGRAGSLLDEPAAAAFTSVSTYYDAIRLYHESRGWDVSLDPVAAAQFPRPAAGSSDLIRTTLRDRCGVESVED